MSDYLLKIRTSADVSGLTAARQGINALGERIKGAFTGLGPLTGLLAGGALTAFGKQLLQDADRLQDLATAADTSAESLQRLAAATREDGIEIDALASSLGKLALFQGKVAAGDKEALKVANRLALDPAKVATQDRVALFYDLADALSAIPNPAERARLSVALFSEAGQNLLPTLLQGKTALLEMGEAATVMGDKTVAELAKVNSELEKAVLNAKTFGSGLLASAAKGAAGVGVLLGTLAERDRIEEQYRQDLKLYEQKGDQTGQARIQLAHEARNGAQLKGFSPEAIMKEIADALKAFDAAQPLSPAEARARRDRELAALADVATRNFDDPLGTAPAQPPAKPKPAEGTGPQKPTPSPLDKASPATLSDRITSIGGVIAANAGSLRALDRTATATEETARAVNQLVAQTRSGSSQPRQAIFSA